mmetsp:Transcript_27245/g.47214  ORF Transcript_27245/g.47214 Transcript_27245/m.47214 type:complete len:259 (-) Transcript_27245:2311-3087(-)
MASPLLARRAASRIMLQVKYPKCRRKVERHPQRGQARCRVIKHPAEEVLRLRTNHSQGLPLQPHALTTRKATVKTVNHMNLAIARATEMKDMAGEALDMIIIIIVVAAANSTMNLIGEMEGGNKIIIATMMIEIGGMMNGVIDQAGNGIENLSEIIITIAETALKIHIGTMTMDKITRGVMRNVIDMNMIMIMIITMALTMIMVQLLLEMSIEHNTKEGPSVIQRLLKLRINRTANQSSHPRPLLRRLIRRSFPKLRS